MPRIMQATIVRTSVKRRLVLPSLTIALVMLRPNPVLANTPTTMPTQVQATATVTVCLAPSASASSIALKLMRVDGRSQETTIVARIVQKAEKITVVPEKNSMYNRNKIGSSRWPF